VLASTPTPPCFGDIDYDKFVGGGDLALILAAWGTYPAIGDPPPGDLNHDGIIDGVDLATLLANWRRCPD
jgi:hypothetical protein